MTKEEFILELEKMNIEINNEQLLKLEEFYKLLISYNEKVNLTRITIKKEVYLKHFYDSLTIVKEIDFTRNLKICDVGSGAGFPGIVLKIIFPNLNIVLIDALEKRVKFLNDVITCLNLDGITAIHARMEEFSKNNIEQFDLITSRAVARTSIILEMSIKSLKIGGNIVLLKSEIDKELENLVSIEKEFDLKLINKNEFYLPIENSKRTILNFRKMSQTKNKYPRLFSQIK